MQKTSDEKAAHLGGLEDRRSTGETVQKIMRCWCWATNPASRHFTCLDKTTIPACTDRKSILHYIGCDWLGKER